jgi:hypothetical protein
MSFLVKGFLCLLLLGGAAARAEEDWFDPAYLQGHTIANGTGFIAVPAAQVLEGNALSGSIHRYQLKIGYGLWDLAEFGLSDDLNQDTSIQSILDNLHLHGRLQFLKQDVESALAVLARKALALPESSFEQFDLSAGVENLGFEAPGWGRGIAFHAFQDPDPGGPGPQVYYLVAGRTVPYLPSMMATLGWAWAGGIRQGLFGNLSKILFPGMLAEAEYDGQGTNVGVRMLLSSQIKLDLALYHTQDVDFNQYFGRFLERNSVFGVSYTESVQWGWLEGI